jgi:hypothetical protein
MDVLASVTDCIQMSAQIRHLTSGRALATCLKRTALEFHWEPGMADIIDLSLCDEDAMTSQGLLVQQAGNSRRHLGDFLKQRFP